MVSEFGTILTLDLTQLVKTIALILSLGFDTFAVAVGLGISGLGSRERYRFGVSFALAEGIMPLIGFALGQVVAATIGEAASYAAIALLFGVGVYTLWEALHEEEREYRDASIVTLAATALSVSLDELALGFGLGLLQLPIVLAVLLIALQAFALTLAGIRLGAAIGEVVAHRAELISGSVLTLLALFLLGAKL
ncbi:MAG TPA: manganese efflux pump, partial [Chloroflexota bacterium]